MEIDLDYDPKNFDFVTFDSDTEEDEPEANTLNTLPDEDKETLNYIINKPDAVLYKNKQSINLQDLFTQFSNDAPDDTDYIFSWSFERDNECFNKTSKDIIRFNKSINHYINLFQYAFSFASKYNDIPTSNDKNIIFSFTPIITTDSPPDVSKEGNNNCFIELIKDRVTPDKYKQLLEEYKDGITPEEIKYVCHKLKINIIIKDILGNKWVSHKFYEHAKTLKTVHHNKHIELYTQEKIPEEQEFKTKEELINIIKTENTTVILGTVNNPKSVITKNKIYKDVENLFMSEEDEKINKEKIDIYTNTLLSRALKNIKTKYKLEPTYNDELGNFIKAAMHGAIIYTNDKVRDKYYVYDQKRAYSRYQENKYYEQFRFPYKPSHFYKAHNQEINNTGFSQINNVNIKKDFLREIKYIQDYGVYTNLRLKFLRDNNYADFDIINVAFCPKNQHIDLNIKKIDNIKIPEHRLKEIQNALTGRLVPHSRNVIKSISTNSKKEFNHLRFILKERVISAFKINDIYQISYRDSTKVSKTYHHIYNYILDYQQTSILPFIIDNYELLASVQTDGVYLTDKAIRQPKKEEFFKDKIETTNKLYSGRKYNDIIKTTYNLQPFPVFYDQPELLKTNNRFNIEGIAGTGKTTNLTTYGPLYNSILLMPTNALVAEFNNIDCMTYHKFYSIGTTYKKNYMDNYSNIIIDEATMIDNDTFQKLLKRTPASKNLYVISGIKQLKPVEGDPIVFNNFHKITLTTIKRTDNVDYYNRQKKLIELNSIHDKIKLFEDRILNKDLIYKKYRFNSLDIILCSTLKDRNYYNDKLFKKAVKHKTLIPISFNYTNKKVAKSQRKLIKKENYDEKIHSLAFASTVHVVQGKTIDYNIFISTTNIWCKELLNVALSRSKKIDNVYLLK